MPGWRSGLTQRSRMPNFKKVPVQNKREPCPLGLTGSNPVPGVFIKEYYENQIYPPISFPDLLQARHLFLK